MRNLSLTLPEVGFIAGTRGALGAGIGLLLSDKLTEPQRRAVGWVLVAVGVITTIPAAIAIFGRREA
jgi:multisubunit Na+/H+ antiporter MnhB subunit